MRYAEVTDMKRIFGGTLTLKNGRIDKYQFDEGYCQAEKYIYNTSQDDFTFCYYDQDHLGNIRQVTEADGSSKGEVIQTMRYYPFGAQFCDGTADSNVQSRRYNGKEFDGMHGLNTYDYGARQYNPVTARWDRVDPLCEKYYSISPYAYCANNPVKFVDPDGRVVNLAAGGIGAIAGAGIYACVAYWEGKSSKEIWGAATEGAIVGGMAGLTMGASTAITTSSIAVDASISALSSGIGNATNQLISKGDINSNEVENSLVSGALSGTMGSVGGTLVNKCGKMAEGAIAAKAENTIANARNLAYSQAEQTGAKMGGKYAKQQVNKETSRIIANTKSSASSEIKTTKIITTGKNWSVQMGVGSITSKVSECYDSAKEKVKSVFKMIF